MWPTDRAALVAAQQELARRHPEPWVPTEHPRVGGVWASFPRGISGPGRAGDPVWAAAVVLRDGVVLAERVVTGTAGAPYEPGLLALRVGPVLEAALAELPGIPDVVMVDAGGRDHPRRAGLAVHLGAVVGVATVGVTHRPLLATGAWPGEDRGETSPLRIDDEVVGCWMRTRPGVRPLVVHPGWRTDLRTSVDLVASTTRRQRTPDPLREARRVARQARAAYSTS